MENEETLLFSVWFWYNPKYKNVLIGFVILIHLPLFLGND